MFSRRKLPGYVLLFWMLVPSLQWVVVRNPNRCNKLPPRSPTFSQHRLLVATHSSSTLRAIDFDSLMDMDVVLYSLRDDDTTRYIGAVQEDGTLSPLSVWSKNPVFGNSLEFLVDEHDRFPGLLPDQVIVHSLVKESDLSYGSRQVGGGKGPGNPHGEESELLYYVDKDAVQNVEFSVKPELEILW